MSYDSAFFESQMTGSRRSADIIAAICVDLIHPSSVVDIGCGAGTWLAAFSALGIHDIDGFDGDYIDRSLLQIPSDRFHAMDLNQRVLSPRTYALAVSLEVAEHLRPARAESFVADLVQLAPAVLFSAAIPHQGGTGHINERWQDYWAALFATHSYRPLDVIRPRVWENDAVEPWYAQNTLIYGGPASTLGSSGSWPLRIVHPRLHEWRADPESWPVRQAVQHAISSLCIHARNRLLR